MQRSVEELEDENRAEELERTFTLELESANDELENSAVEDERSDEELDADSCTLLEDPSAEDELSPSVPEPLFPLSPPQARKIRATAAMPGKTNRCFCFISLFLSLEARPS